MKSQPIPGYVSNDDVQTPPPLCRALVEHFHPRGVILEPCMGEGNFFRAIKDELEQSGAWVGAELLAMEIKQGRDFYDLPNERDFDWIVTNPPWSKLSERTKPMSFLEKALQVSYNVVFLCTLNHLIGLKARYKLLDKYGFGIPDIVLLDTPPKPWPQAGFQVGAVHFKHGYDYTLKGMTDFTDLRGKIDYSERND